jgi:hypothetical protein
VVAVVGARERPLVRLNHLHRETVTPSRRRRRNAKERGTNFTPSNHKRYAYSLLFNSTVNRPAPAPAPAVAAVVVN